MASTILSETGPAIAYTRGMGEVVKTKINPNGRVVIPLNMRKALGVKPGDEVMMRMVDGELRIYTVDHSLEQLRRELRELTLEGGSLVEDLVCQRRGEAHGEARERADGDEA
jgi:AbrB family looped-hinge helix DNA binding protein